MYRDNEARNFLQRTNAAICKNDLKVLMSLVALTASLPPHPPSIFSEARFTGTNVCLHQLIRSAGSHMSHGLISIPAATVPTPCPTP